MPTRYYVEQIDDEGNKTYVEAEVVVDDIEDDVIRTHPAYQKLLDENIKRRKENKALKEQVPVATDDKQEEAPQPTPQQKPLDPDELFSQFLGKLEEREAQKQQKAASLKSIAEKHKLPDEALDVLANSSDPEKTAAYLGRVQVQLSASTQGASPNVDTVESLMGRVSERLNLTTP